MKSKIFIPILIFIILISFTFAVDLQFHKEAQIFIKSGTSKPTLIKYTGTERNDFTPIISDKEICFKQEKASLESSLDYYDKKENKLPLTKKKDGKETLFCTTNLDYVKLGSNTIILENQTTNTVVYSPFDTFNITARLDWDYNKDGVYDNPINDVFVLATDVKFGANYIPTNYTENFRYDFSSTLPIIEKNNLYYFKTGLGGYYLDLTDICSPDILPNNISISANCKYDYNPETQNNKTIYHLYVYFNDYDGFIDPSYKYKILQSNLLLNDVLFNERFTYLNISDTSPYDSLVGYWSFDADNYQDYNSACVVGSCVELDGDDYIILNETDSRPTGNFTISTWINVNTLPTDSASRMYPITNDLNGALDGWGLFINNAPDVFQFRANDLTTEYVDATTVISANQWYHVVARYNGTTLSIFVNGSLEGSSASTGSIRYDNDNPFAFGKRISNDDFKFDGLIDEFYLYDEALTDAEIKTIYDRNVAGLSTNITTGLKINIPFEGNATNVQNGAEELGSVRDESSYDLTNNDNDGSYEGGAYAGSGKYDDGLVLDGDSDYVQTTYDGVLGENSRSFSAWIKTTSESDQGIISYGTASLGEKFVIRIDEDFENEWTIRTEVQGGYKRAETPVNDGDWHHVVVVLEDDGSLDITEADIYVDGSLEATDGSGSQSINTSSGTDVTVGYDSFSNFYFNGSIDEVMIFNTALNSTQISDIYNNQTNRFKSVGTQVFPNIYNVATTSYNRINLTLPYSELNYNTSLQGRMGGWNKGLGYNTSMDGLVAYYHADGDATDSSGNGNDGTFEGDATTGDGVYNSSFELDGSGDWVNISDTNFPTGTDNRTFAAWVKIQDPTERYRLFAYGDGTTNNDWIINVDTDAICSEGVDGVLLFTDNGESVCDNTVVADGTWHHVAVVGEDGSSVDFYVDGEFKSSDSITYDTVLGSRHGIGAHSSGDSLWFNGSIDEVMIFNRSLSSKEIKELYIKGRANWNYSTWYDFTLGECNNIHIGSKSTNYLPEIKLVSNDNFYTPYVLNSLNITFKNVKEFNINITHPINNQWYTSDSLFVNATSNYNVSSWRYNLGGTNVSFTVPSNISINISGVYSLVVYGTNEFGVNATSNEVNFTFVYVDDQSEKIEEIMEEINMIAIVLGLIAGICVFGYLGAKAKGIFVKVALYGIALAEVVMIMQLLYMNELGVSLANVLQTNFNIVWIVAAGIAIIVCIALVLKVIKKADEGQIDETFDDKKWQ